MAFDHYQLKAGLHFTVFEFVSQGPKGLIPKRVLFQLTETDDVYNLAFGDATQLNGEIDDLVVSNNGDREKVLMTVAESVRRFFNHRPTAYVYLTGRTAARTRLYQMGITRFYEDLMPGFTIYGQTDVDFEKFRIGKNYDGFLIRRKPVKLPV